MLLQNIRAKISARLSGEGEAGFTLIELLVVMLILGILAAIAIPAFFNQASKASDASAKENLHTAQVTMTTCLNENQENFETCAGEHGQEKLNEIEGAVPAASGETLEVEEISGTGKEGYLLKSTGAHSIKWEIEYTQGAEGEGLKYTCSPVEGACTGEWAE